MSHFYCCNSIRLISNGKQTETTAESDQRSPGITCSPCHLYGNMRCPYALLHSHQCLLSCDASLCAPIYLHCVTLPPSVWEPQGASRHCPSAHSLQGKQVKEGGVGLIEKRREGVKMGRERERKWKRSHSSPCSDQSTVSLILQLQQSACIWAFPVPYKKQRKKHLRLNCPEVVLFLLHQIGRNVGPPTAGMHKDWAKFRRTKHKGVGGEMYSNRVNQTGQIKLPLSIVICVYVKGNQ